MLPVDGAPAEDEVNFVHEIKWDGYRVLADLRSSDVELVSRNGYSLNDRFPQVVDVLKKMELEAILDGEIVALNREGRVDFSLLQARRPADTYYVVFDLLSARGENLCPKPWYQRRENLEDLVPSGGATLVSPLLPGVAQDCLAFAIEQGFEGIVSKRQDSPYLPGVRSRSWLKQKLRRSLDCLLVGVRKEGNRLRSASVAAYLEDGSLMFLGNVGSGFGLEDYKFLEEAVGVIGQLPHCPCTNPPKDEGEWIWCKPVLILEVEYFELTPSRRLRHPVFLRFRFDKDPKDCRIEV